MKITYRQLFEKLKTLNNQQLDQDVTISLDISEEAIPVKDLVLVKESDFLDGILDIDHPVLTVDF